MRDPTIIKKLVLTCKEEDSILEETSLIKDLTQEDRTMDRVCSDAL